MAANMWFGGMGAAPPVQQDEANYELWDCERVGEYLAWHMKLNEQQTQQTIAWCKKHEVPIQKQFPKTLLAKFAWAMNTDPEYRF